MSGSEADERIHAAMTGTWVAIPEGTRLVLGRGVAAITDEPEFVMPKIGALEPPDVFSQGGDYTKGVGYGATVEESVRAAIADYTAKRLARP